MYVSSESAPIFNLAQGTEQVDIHKIVELDYEAETAVALLHSFAQNSGKLKIDSNKAERPLGIMFEVPAHFSNYPRTRQYDTRPWDVIVHKETGFTAATAAEVLSGEDLKDTRYIFPHDGLTLDQDGFNETLTMDTQTAEAIQSKGLAYHQYFHAAPKNAIKRWAGSLIIKDLNKKINLPPRKAEENKPIPEPQYRKQDALLAKQETARLCWVMPQQKVITYTQAITAYTPRNRKEAIYSDWFAE